jgi:uncharacterized membrane protein YfcA
MQVLELVLSVGVVAGAVSTLAGQGGGLLALLALSAAIGPREALVLTAPGLLVANVHRAWLYRRSIDHSVAWRVGRAVVPVSVLVGALAVKAPTAALRALLVLATGVALAKALGWARFHVSPRWLGPAGAIVGAFGASAGGAGLLLTPVLVSVGLTGEALIATTAALAVGLNGGRLLGYGLGGSLSWAILPMALAMTAALLVGNTLGHKARRWLSAKQLRALELSTMALATALVAVGARG